MNAFISPPPFSSLKTTGNNRKKKVMIVLTVVLLFLLLTSTVVYACNCGATGGEHTKGEFPCTEGWDPLAKAAYTFKGCLYMVGLENSDYLLKVVLDDGDSSTDFDSEKVWRGIKEAYDTILPIGYFLIILYFILDIIERSTLDNLNAETIVKSSIKLFIGVYLISNGLSLIETAASFGASLVDSIKGDSSSVANSAALRALHAELKGISWWKALGVILDSFIPYLLSLLCSLVMYFMIYSRYIEIAVRAVFAPIGMASIYSGGMNSSGMKYFKKFLATCLQGAIMSAIMLTGNLVSTAITVSGNTWGTLFGISGIATLVVYLCVAGALIKSKNIANDLIGV